MGPIIGEIVIQQTWVSTFNKSTRFIISKKKYFTHPNVEILVHLQVEVDQSHTNSLDWR